MSEMPPVKRSTVWNSFTQESSGTAVCNLCSRKIKTCNNTSNLRGHLERMHKSYFVKKILANDNAAASSDNGNKPVDEGTHVSLNASKVSLTTTITVSEEQGQPSSPCSDVTKCKQPSIFNSFSNIQQFRLGGKKEIEITNLIMYMIVKDNLPLSFVERPGFKKLLHKILPLYSIPSRRTITRLLDSRYDILSCDFREKLETVDCYSITTDIWTETHQSISYLGVTVHFKESDFMKSSTVGVYELQERHTASYISEIFRKVVQEWNIDFNKVLAVVTDNGQNIVKARSDTFGVNKHVRCFAHTLNLVAENSLKAVPEIFALIEKIKKIVTWFKQSIVASDALRKSQLEDVTENEVLKLIQSVETRWNSKFYMLERFLHLRKYINNVLLNERSAPAAINGDEFNTLKELKTLLQPLEVVTKEVSSDHHVTLSKIIPLIHCMEQAIDKCTPESEEVKNFQKALKTEVEKRFGKMEQVEKLAIATIMDPRFKKIHFRDITAAARAVGIIKKKLITAGNPSLQNEHPITVPDTDSDKVDCAEKFDLWDQHNKLVDQLENRFSNETKDHDQINSEISQDLNSSVFPLQTNPFQVWNSLKLTYPHIYTMAIQYLQIPATSVPAERLFSKAGQIMSDQRSQIKPKRLNKILFLNSLDEDVWNIKF